MERIAVIDFETNGLSPGSSCRATEIAVILVENGKMVDRYQSLMNAGVWIPSDIERLTGISNRMLKSAPPASEVMQEAARFVGNTPLLAHNASFDKKFWDYELGLLGQRRTQDFACSMLLARRLLPQAPNHKLGTLNRYLGLPDTGRAHRALADTEMAANLALYLASHLQQHYGLAEVTHGLLCKLQKQPAAKVKVWLQGLSV
ncbi:3'-5' exonuclease [Craterilacuibacter sinensis]|uniref:3'-5' exonuclease n=1 Tax=Craterilacuibacter sinensis TaxID=2686017 RepID=A0A845BTR0_9NEIS|nr:3'-5' exonuclease [Craterilacuibacter sinensis]MXR37981.1 3'-5' exonuclease [Craterilacuibacter sinensis]RQW26556.1 3'-5' exonuclease [Rhodobacteraceae bacterium CH30]